MTPLEWPTALKEKGAVPAPPGGWPKLWKTLGRSKWVVYCKRPFAGPEQVLSYLANYTHRVAISERRIVAFDETARTVTFRWRDYREKGAGAVKLCTLDVDEFLRRFRRHLLPRGFTKVRHYGLLANNARRKLIPAARQALAATGGRRKRPAATPPAAAEPSGWPPPCPRCGSRHVRCIAVVGADGRRTTLRRPNCARTREPP
jgi:hypothetical protein